MYKFPVREEERERESDMSRGKITASVFLRVKREEETTVLRVLCRSAISILLIILYYSL